MAHLTRCYVSDMRLYRDRPDVITRGRWYWCPPGAVPIPYFHVFGTQYQESDQHKVDPPVGEVPVRIKWTDGQGDHRFTGQQWCGDKTVWTKGALYSQRGTPAVDAGGVPPCCNPPPLDPGGVVVNGNSAFASGPNEPSRGGVLLGGVVRTQPTTGLPSGGGVLLGGVVHTQQPAGLPTRGGVLLGGVVTSQPGVGLPSGGGVLLGGIVSTRSVPGGNAVGGVLLGGIVPTFTVPGGSASGGVLLGGIVTAITSPGGSASGGVLLGGVVQTSQSTPGSGLGGVLLGGVVPTIGGGGIVTACCPGHPTPTHLYWRSSGASDSSLNVTLNALYDATFNDWATDLVLWGICGGEQFFFVCDGVTWKFQGNAFGASWNTPAASVDCGPPLYVTFDPNAVGGFNAIMEGTGCIGVGDGPTLIEVSSVPF